MKDQLTILCIENHGMLKAGDTIKGVLVTGEWGGPRIKVDESTLPYCTEVPHLLVREGKIQHKRFTFAQ